MNKNEKKVTVKLEKIINGGQTIGKDQNCKKILVWGGLPGEIVEVDLRKQKSSWAEGVVTNVILASKDRIEPTDKESFISSSPWQIMSYKTEVKFKKQLIKDAFEQFKIELPAKTEVISDNKFFGYRNKMEFSFWWDNNDNKVKLALFNRGSHNKIAINKSALAMPQINKSANSILELIQSNDSIQARDLKTLIVRSSQSGDIVAQLYVKKQDFPIISKSQFDNLNIKGFSVIYSNPKSPASVITNKLQDFGDLKLSDKLLGQDFQYNAEGFFQINIPVYELVLKDIKKFIDENKEVIDLYSGVGTIGLSTTNGSLVSIESNPSSYEELVNNVSKTSRTNVTTLNNEAEKSLENLDPNSLVIVDPPRAGMHENLTKHLYDFGPDKIIYLSCNPVTQARDYFLLKDKYRVILNKGYNFFPRTPHIEHLLVLAKT